jgi:hypothetical protein
MGRECRRPREERKKKLKKKEREPETGKKENPVLKEAEMVGGGRNPDALILRKKRKKIKQKDRSMEQSAMKERAEN